MDARRQLRKAIARTTPASRWFSWLSIGTTLRDVAGLNLFLFFKWRRSMGWTRAAQKRSFPPRKFPHSWFSSLLNFIVSHPPPPQSVRTDGRSVIHVTTKLKQLDHILEVWDSTVILVSRRSYVNTCGRHLNTHTHTEVFPKTGNLAADSLVSKPTSLKRPKTFRVPYTDMKHETLPIFCFLWFRKHPKRSVSQSLLN